jgi:LPXTG-site transpeptidase (sortase) family protein
VALHATTIRLIYRALFAAGIAALLWVGGQIAYATTYQRYLLSRLKDQAALANESGSSSSPLRSGELVGRLDIAERKLSVVVVEGVDDDTLAIAAGHVPGTSLPGSRGNIVIAAHRDTFFRELRNIRAGNKIQLSTPRGTFAYVVTNTEIVKPSETRVLESRGHSELTLVTCYPFSFLGAAPKRFIVHARPEADPTGSD